MNLINISFQQERRILKSEVEHCGPGPGSYSVPRINGRKDFNTASVTHNFHLPIAQTSLESNRGNPAPNTYQVFI